MAYASSTISRAVKGQGTLNLEVEVCQGVRPPVQTLAET